MRQPTHLLFEARALTPDEGMYDAKKAAQRTMARSYLNEYQKNKSKKIPSHTRVRHSAARFP